MCKKFRYFYRISDITLCIETDHKFQAESNFVPFITGNTSPDYIIRFNKVNCLSLNSEKFIHEESCYRVYQREDGSYIRTFFDPPRDYTPYAVVTYDYQNGMIQVDYLEKGAHCVSELHNSFAHVNFEEILLRKNRLCLHASCVDTHIGGILFSGPSGVGKSTQANLWCTLRSADQINGDRPILSSSENAWIAWGSPYAGSSKCHVNKSCSIRAIVLLSKGKECVIRKLGVSEAFHKVWAGLTIHTWDYRFVSDAFELSKKLVNEIPVYEMICTPDEKAVLCLENELRRGCNT